jgi:drug/metabolite transporter (DMT)-like permease
MQAPLRLALLVVLALLGFAANSVLARLALGDRSIGAAAYTGVRLLAGAATLAGLVAARRQPLELSPALKTRARRQAGAALFVYAIAFSAAYLMLGAGTGALILFATVQFTILGWALRKGDQPGAMALLGLAAALAGFVYLVLPGLRAPDALGAVLMVVAGVAWAVYTLLGRGSVAPLRDSAQNFVLTVPLALLCVVSLALEPWHWSGIGWAIVSGALASGVGYAIWYAVLPSLSRVQSGIVQLCVPAIAAGAGIVLLGEQPTLRLGIATVLILGGVAVAITVRPKAP